MARADAVHATAVAIGGRGLLIQGPSRAGKSRLALALIDCSTRRHPIRLIGDDRILLRSKGNEVSASPHHRIAGFIERRGLGIIAMKFETEVAIAAIVVLEPLGTKAVGAQAGTGSLKDQNFPWLSIVTSKDTGDNAVWATQTANLVLDWFLQVDMGTRDMGTTLGRKSSDMMPINSKD